MKKISILLSFILILTFSTCATVFASDSTCTMSTSVIEVPTTTFDLGHAQIRPLAAKSNGLTASAYRVSSTYMRVTFSNSTNSKIKDTVNVADAVYTGEHISGPFSITVPAKGSKSYDVYIGGYTDVYVITGSHGYFHLSF